VSRSGGESRSRRESKSCRKTRSSREPRSRRELRSCRMTRSSSRVRSNRPLVRCPLEPALSVAFYEYGIWIFSEIIFSACTVHITSAELDVRPKWFLTSQQFRCILRRKILMNNIRK
jgi:hypothetical protein